VSLAGELFEESATSMATDVTVQQWQGWMANFVPLPSSSLQLSSNAVQIEQPER
jgi:hypothetical protein